MKNQFSLYDLLILFGIIQGVITSFLLIFSKMNTRSNKFLGLALLSFCFLSSKTLLHTLHLWDTTTFRFFPIGIELAIPPLFFYYVKSLVTPNEIDKFRTAKDEVVYKEKEIYLHIPDGFGSSKLSNNVFERKLKVAATIRNWKTTIKLLELCKILA